jgi:hypothetical protein
LNETDKKGNNITYPSLSGKPSILLNVTNHEEEWNRENTENKDKPAQDSTPSWIFVFLESSAGLVY